MKAKFPTANFTSLIAKIAEDKLLAAQKEQARLGWQMQSARNHAMKYKEQAQVMHEQRQAYLQSQRESAKPAAHSSWSSWIESVFKAISRAYHICS